MPTYAYQCDNCDAEIEKFQSITANPIKKCPECGKLKLRRLIGTGAGIIFKGAGFYETDYRSESYKAGAESEKSRSEKKDSKSTEKKSESKTTSSSSSDTKKSTSDKKKSA